MKVYNLKDKLEYLNEVANLEYEEWANKKDEKKQERIKRKKEKICNEFNLQKNPPEFRGYEA